jgi:hypothetical protein
MEEQAAVRSLISCEGHVTADDVLLFPTSWPPVAVCSDVAVVLS